MKNLKQLLSLANRFYDNAQDDEVALIHKLVRSHINIELPSTYKKADKTKPIVVLVRHGQTDFNKSDGKSNNSVERLRGWLDVPLNIDGIVSAEKLGQYFHNFNVAKIIHSDLSRAEDTAKAIARYTNAPINENNNLRPFNMGAVTGKPVEEYVPVLIKHIKDEMAVPEGSTENFSFFKKRFLTAMLQLMNEAIQYPQRGLYVAVAHSRNTRAWRDFLNSGAKDIDNMDKSTLLQKEDPVATGHFMAAEYDEKNKKWQLIELPHQEILDKE